MEKRLFVGVVFDAFDDNTGFRNLKDTLKGVLIIYNDYIKEWVNGETDPEPLGYGSGFLRKYRSDAQGDKLKNYVLGIPILSYVPTRLDERSIKLTDSVEIECNNKKYNVTNEEIINMSIQNIKDIILKNDIRYIFLPTDKNKNIVYHKNEKVESNFESFINTAIDKMIIDVGGEIKLQKSLSEL